MRLKATLNPLVAIAALTILLAAASPVAGATVNIDPVLQAQFADSLMKNRQYRRAAEEYQRFAFFFQDHPDRRAMQLNAGRAFLLANDPQMALTQLRPLTATTRSIQLPWNLTFCPPGVSFSCGRIPMPWSS